MKKLAIFLSLIVSISACKKDEAPTTELIINSYPTTIGSEWRYKRTYTILTDTSNLITLNESRVVTIEKDSTINGIDVMKYRTTSIEYPQSYSASFKRQTSQGIYTHAYTGADLDATIYIIDTNNLNE